MWTQSLVETVGDVDTPVENNNGGGGEFDARANQCIHTV